MNNYCTRTLFCLHVCDVFNFLLIYLAGRDLKTMTMRQLFEDYGLDENTQSFTGHAMALHRDDTYLNRYSQHAGLL